ncbi:MAG: glucan 1,3-beta-glucosidase [Abditibacteriota bacterium]|nr:glucan 1,3-beta-glucosidase [Abditibacteriota bacterium]
MQRRQFLYNTLAGAVALPSSRTLFAQAPVAQAPLGQTPPGQTPAAQAVANRDQFTASKLRGVNLGGWLLLEKWMTPSLFKDTTAPDEYELSRALGNKAAAHLNRHRETFITEEDFRWIKARGLNAIRLPIGYWALDAPKPFVSAARFVDWAFAQAKQHGLKVLLDLHGAPGSQNAWDHSGRSGTLGWHTDAANIQSTLRVIESLAERYGTHPNLYGIELLNEPRWDVPIDLLKAYYRDAYQRVRAHTGKRVAVVIHDGFRPFEWKSFLTEPEASHVVLDTHLYQAYTDEDRKRSPMEHVAFALDRKKHLDAMSGQLWTMVGEWSIALPSEIWKGRNSFEIENAKRAYGAAQLLSYDTTQGWFYWNYKLEYDSDWSFRHCVQHGLMPDNYADRTRAA